MTYKIVFSDIDGTLLNKDRRLSPLTCRVIRELQKQVPVVLISSRMPQAMRHLQQELHIEHQPLICYNGGLVLVDGKTMSSTEIPVNILAQLQKYNTKHKCHISLFNNEDWFVPAMDFWAKREENNTKVTPVVRAPEEVLAEWQQQNKGAHKLMCMGDEEKIDRIVDFLTAQFDKELHLYRSKPTYLEIANRKVSKLTAIELLLEEHFKLSLAETVAFGDNYNDHEMLKAVGMGIAVGNAKTEILEIAREVTSHGHEDGVALSLQNLFRIS